MLIVVLCATLIGGGAAFYLFNKIVVKAESSNESLVSAFQIGAFTNYNNAIKVSDRNNGIIVKDDDIYRVFVAVLHNQEAINILKKYYQEIGLNYYLKEISVSKSFVDEIREEEMLLINSSSDTYVTLNSEILHKYEELLKE